MWYYITLINKNLEKLRCKELPVFVQNYQSTKNKAFPGHYERELPSNLETRLWENLIMWSWGELSKRWGAASVIWLWERSSSWREGSRNAPSDIVCIWLCEIFRIRREGNPTRTKVWRTWRLFELRSKLLRLGMELTSSVDLDKDFSLFLLKIRTSKDFHWLRNTTSRWSILFSDRINLIAEKDFSLFCALTGAFGILL